MTNWKDFPKELLENNPELADALRTGKSIRIKNQPSIKTVNRAPSFTYAWKITGQHPFSDPKPEYKFEMHRDFRFDFAFVAYRVAVEVDGGQWLEHGGRHARNSDRDKLNLAAALGWLIFRFSPDQLEESPAACVDLVIQALLLRASSLTDIN